MSVRTDDPILLAACDHCGVDRQKIWEAQQLAYAAVGFLRETEPKADAARSIVPSLAYEAGIMHALAWVLGADPGARFQAHLEALGRINHDLRSR